MPALEQLIGADYTGYDPSGRHQDRAGVLRAYANGRVRVATLAQTELSARVVGEVGLVTGVSAFRGTRETSPSTSGSDFSTSTPGATGAGS